MSIIPDFGSFVNNHSAADLTSPVSVPQFSRLRRDFVKLMISHGIAFALSWFAVSYVFLGPLPRVRPDLKERVVELPAKVSSAIADQLDGGKQGDQGGGTQGGQEGSQGGGKQAGQAQSPAGFFAGAVAFVKGLFSQGQPVAQLPQETPAILSAPWVFGDTVMALPVTPVSGGGGSGSGRSDSGQAGGSGSTQSPTPTQSPFRIPQLPTGFPGGSEPTSSPRTGPSTAPTSVQRPTATPRPTARPTRVPTVVPTRPPTQSEPVSLAQIESGVLAEINRRRNAAGLVELRAQSQLTAAARGHSAYMKRTGKLSHTGEGGSLPHDRAQDAGYRGQPYGETVIVGYPTPVDIVDAWWNSPGHKAILTAPAIREAGVGWSGSWGTALVGL